MKLEFSRQIFEKYTFSKNFMVTPCISNTEPFLLPTDAHNFKKRRVIKNSKLDKNAPTCFGLHRNHLQGAKVRTFTHLRRSCNNFGVTIREENQRNSKKKPLN